MTDCLEIEIECDYYEDIGNHCEDGKIKIYADFPIPSSTKTCPKCNGTGKVKVSPEYIENLIEELVADRNTINNGLRHWRAVLAKYMRSLSFQPFIGQVLGKKARRKKSKRK